MITPIEIISQRRDLHSRIGALQALSLTTRLRNFIIDDKYNTLALAKLILSYFNITHLIKKPLSFKYLVLIIK